MGSTSVVSRNLLILAACGLLLFPAAAGAQTNAGWQVSLQWPAQGAITSPFGHDGARWHPGLDIGILQSLDVRAADDGVVVLAGYMSGYDGYGAIVALQHRFGYSTLYAHLSQPLVHSGQRVRRGEKIAIAGCTGWCTGTHLHFELRYEGIPVDPTLLMVG
ncbi:MAG: M23 family metallopeptidase [Actinobacteria bacterium]|nr:MAG: M23 family metallopeptidase [Actinomycetota bacterium]